jgi:hypothetical protein
MNTDELVLHSRARFDHHQARRVLKEKYQAKLNFAYQGGMFCASPEMITFLSLFPDQQIVVQDLYENPVQVDAMQLRELMTQRWQEQMNAWLIDYQQLNQNR